MTAAKEIMERAALTLQDPDYTRWTKPEMLEWLSEAQIAIARTPGAYSKVKTLALVEGTHQKIPEDGWSLITVTRNFDADGVPLTPVRLVTRSLLDAVVPQWHMETPSQLVQNYVYDDRFPKEFFVYPPNDGYGFVEAVYMGIPARITEETQPLELDDTFVPALVSYVLYRAFSKESDYSSGAQSAVQYFQAYSSELTAAIQARGQTTPNAALMPGVVNANGGTE